LIALPFPGGHPSLPGLVASVRHEELRRITERGDRSYRDVLLAALEKGSEPEVDEDIIGALTLLEDGAFWHTYLTSPRGSRWGISFWAKVLCDISTKSLFLRHVSGVEARVTLNDKVICDRLPKGW
jgi:hypothetical protein